MSTIKDPWEMLEEARDSLFSLGESSANAFNTGDRLSYKQSNQDAAEIHARIDAALAERQNSAKDVVEWAEGPFGASQIATVAGWELDVGYVWVSPTKSEWRVSLQRAGESKEELMTTAIAAARGMR
jgi:hypothetical protein